jgi:ATP-dependent Lon protease
MPKGKPDTPSAQRLPAPVTTAPVSVLPPVVTIPQTKNAVLAHHPFPDAKRSVPSLLFSDISPSLKAKGFSIPNHGDIVLVEITVRHVPTGVGPVVTSDEHFRVDSAMALRQAVSAAAKAAHYNPAFLEVHLAMPVASMFNAGQQIDGPSAGVGWTIAVASALLGDPVRSDVCLTGTMDETLKVGRIGGAEHKIEGCHKLGYREMILPAGQSSFELNIKRQSFGIKVTEVSTLAEAYEAATGQSLRPAR